MTAAPTIPRRAGTGPAPLSFPQERLFLLDRLMPGLSAYNVPTLVRVRHSLDEGSLRRALAAVVARHEVLRTRISLVEGLPVQEVSPPEEVELEVSDLRGRPDAEADALEWLGRFAVRPFDLSQDVLLRAALAHVDDGEDLLLVVFHHIGSDHVSSGLLFAELDGLYGELTGGQPARLPELPIQYSDFARWQREEIAGAHLAELVDYWRERLAGAPERLDLPSDRPRPSVQSHRGRVVDFTLDLELAGRLRALGRSHGASMFMVLLAGWNALLHRYTGVEDVVVGAPASGRHHEETAHLLGFFSNTLALRTDLTGEPSFAELLARVRTTAMEAQMFGELPFEKLVEVVNPPRSQSHTPIFQVLFGYDVAPSQPARLAGSELEPLPIPGWEWSRFDLSVVAREIPDGSLRAQLEYSTDLFDAATIERLIGHYRTLLDSAARDPAQPIAELALLTPQERRRMLVDWNATEGGYDCRPLHQLVAEQAARVPDAVAVVSEVGRVSYAELEGRANQLAHELISRGVRPGGLVGICLERTADLLVCMLAVLKTGSAYVPIDPRYPPERQAFMLADAQAPVLLTQERFAGDVDPGAAQILYVDRDRAVWQRQPATAPGVSVDAGQRAYVIYTSGSTGLPKGAMITHRSVANLIAHMRAAPGFTEGDVLANLTTPAFDLSVPDWYLPLTTGARLVLVPSEVTMDGVELADWLARSGATFVQATPTTWQMLVDAEWKGSAELKIVCGGEALSRALAEELQTRGASLWHMYGPTETTVWSSILRLDPGEGPVPLGPPITNTSMYVRDGHGQPVPIGVPGELHIGGEGLALGYHGRPELTREKFIPDPFSGRVGARLYRTGDLVRWRAGGTLEFLGRIDQQVKLRGFRIELGEIEAVLDAQPTVSASAVIVREDHPGDQRLVGYVLASGREPPDPETLRRACRAKLPPFMVPSAFVVLDAFPVTANGKLDRRALPAPDGSRASAGGEYVAPETPVQQAVAEIFGEVLGLQRVGLQDDFFDLGGHSLLAVKMLARVQERLGLALPLGTVFEHSTVRGLADAIGGELLGDTDEDELAALLSEIEGLE